MTNDNGQFLMDNPTKILYIDDNPMNRVLIKRVLNNYGFEVIEASTGLEGIGIAKQDPPNLILMDINMPGLDGHETTTRMRTIPSLSKTPIIAVTARITKGERELALAAGCDGYIPKPINVDEFPQQIIAYLNGYKDKLTSDERQRYLDQYSHKLVERLEDKLLELQEANSKLRNIDKVKSDFITLSAHELRTPLSLIYGYAGILQALTQTEQPFVEGSVNDLATRIYNASHRLNEVVNDILNISLITANEMQLMPQPVIISEVIEAALTELSPLENERQLNIDLGNIMELPFVMGDAKKLQQAFWNILSNAIKYTPDNGTIAISGQFDEPNKNVLISVKDSGIGLNYSDQKEIFEQFYVVADTTYHRSSKTAFGGGGLGLGLPIAKGIIKAHDGKIWAESPGRDAGTTIFVVLPVAEEFL